MDPKLELMLRGARESLAEGVDSARVEAWLRENGWERSLADLANRVERDRQQSTTAGARQASREAPGGLHPLARLPLAFMRGITAGFLPEMIGTSASSFGYDPEALSQDIRGQLDRASFEHPVQQGAAELTGAMSTLPATGVGGATGRAFPALARAMATGAGFGAVSGAGYAEPGERLAGAARGAAFGAAVSAAPGLGSAAASTLFPRARRVLTQEISKAPRAVSARLKALKQSHDRWARGPQGYGGLDLDNVSVTGAPDYFAQPRVAQAVRDAESISNVGVFPASIPEGVFTGSQVQHIVRRLEASMKLAQRRGDGDLLQRIGGVRDDLENMLEHAAPGYKTVDSRYKILKDRERALEAGVKAAKGAKFRHPVTSEVLDASDPLNIEYAISEIADDRTLDEFRHGFMAGTRPRLPTNPFAPAAQETARAALSPFGVLPLIGRTAGRLIGGAKVERRAERLLPFMFRGRELEDVTRRLAPGAGQRLAQSYGPAGLGFLLGSHDYAQPETEETP